jgi:isopenicillin N synthase-like dioxygenase
MISVPVIDLSQLNSSSEADRADIVAQLMKAATEIGFLQVVNHGIPKELVDTMFAQSAKFFSLPLDTKKKSKHDAVKNVGFESYSQIRPSTGLPDNKESLQLGFAGMDGIFPSQQDCPCFEATAKEFQSQCLQLAKKLLSCFATGLGLPTDFFEAPHDVTQEDSQCTLRCLYYPAIGLDTPRGAWRAGSHTDFDTLTLLFQRIGQGGLEVCAGREAVTDYGGGDTWTPVEPTENAITINIGDLLMRWSDDVLKSNFHRVRMPPPEEANKARYSIAFFAQPNRSALVQGPKQKYPPITAGEYIVQAVAPQFEAKKLWEEAQREAKRTGKEPGPVKVVTAQAAVVA